MRNGSETEIKNASDSFVLIRHGATLSNEQHRYLGNTMDEGLSEAGRAQLSAKRKEVEGYQDFLLFCGPMLRCRQTADILFPGKKYVMIPEWTEICFGEFEGKNYEELKDNPAYQAWLESGGRIPFPKGESREAFIERSLKGYERMRQYLNEHKEQTGGDMPLGVAAVVHGGTIMALASTLWGGDYFDYQVPCGGMWSCII